MIKKLAVMACCCILCFSSSMEGIDVLNFPDEIKSHFNGCFTKQDIVVFLKTLSDDGKIEIEDVEVDDVDFFKRGPALNTYQTIIVSSKIPRIIKLFKRKDEFSWISKLNQREDLIRYEEETKGLKSYPKLIMPEYLCRIKHKRKFIMFCIKPFMPGVNVIRHFMNYKAGKITKEHLGDICFAVGRAYANFQNYFLTDNLNTRKHGDVSLLNIVVSNDLDVYFIDISRMEERGEKQSFQEELKYFIQLPVYQYFRRRKTQQDNKILKLFYNKLLDGYLGSIDERIRNESITTINSSLEIYRKAYSYQSNELLHILQVLETKYLNKADDIEVVM